MAWQTLVEPIYPWARTIDRIITAERPPDLTGSTLAIVSDYGGSDSSSRYETTAIVCADLERSADWEHMRRLVRREYLGDGRRMAYKSLGDRQRAQALIPFLQAAERIHGLCIVTIVNKSLRNLCLNPGDHARMHQAAQLRANWKDAELESALRVTHLVSCVVGGLSRPGQNIYWISDQDSLFANADRHHDVGRLVSKWSSHYARHSLGELGLGTTALDEGDRWEEDMASVADLVAGATAQIATRLGEFCGGCIPHSLAVDYTRPLLPKANCIADWLWSYTGSLKRVVVLFERQRDRRMSVSRFRMES
jgi:hypothetical protein